MQYKDLQHKTDKIHYMIFAIFENQDMEEHEVQIEYLDKEHYKVKLTDVKATELLGDTRYNCTVNISIGRYSAVCEILPDDPMCDESYFIFQYTQNVPMHYEIIRKF
jgi:hypothetical protein